MKDIKSQKLLERRGSSGSGREAGYLDVAGLQFLSSLTIVQTG